MASISILHLRALALVLGLSACGGAAAEPGVEQSLPANDPICESSNTAPGCTPSAVAWAVTCNAPAPAPAVWCSLPEGGDTSGKVWCC